MSLAQRRGMVDREHLLLSIGQQCTRLGVARSSLYYRPREASGENLALMQAMDRQYLDTPFYGSRRMKVWLAREGRCVSRKRVQRLMRIMGLRAIYLVPAPAGRRRSTGSIPTCWKRSELPGPTRRGPPTSPTLAHGPGIPLPGGHHGLAQPVRGGLAIVHHPRGRLLRSTLRKIQEK